MTPDTFRSLYVPTGSPSPDVMLPLYSGHGVVIGLAGGDVSNAGLWWNGTEPPIAGFATWEKGSPFVENDIGTPIHGDPAVGWFPGSVDHVVPLWLPDAPERGASLVHHRVARGEVTDLRSVRELVGAPWAIELWLNQLDDGIDDGGDFTAHGDSDSFVYHKGLRGVWEYAGATRAVSGFGMAFLQSVTTAYSVFGRVIAIMDELGIPREELAQGGGAVNASALQRISGRGDMNVSVNHLTGKPRYVRSIAMAVVRVEPVPIPEESPDMPTTPSQFNEPREGIACLFDGNPNSKGLTFGDMELVWADGSSLQFIAAEPPAGQQKIVQLSSVGFTGDGIVLGTAGDTAKFPWRNPERVLYVEPDGDVHEWDGGLLRTNAGSITTLLFEGSVEPPSPLPDPLTVEERLELIEQRLDLLEEVL